MKHQSQSHLAVYDANNCLLCTHARQLRISFLIALMSFVKKLPNSMLLLTYAYAKALPIRDVSLDDISIEYTQKFIY